MPGFRTISIFLRFGAPINRGVAQLVAHLLWEQGVARSNRVAPTHWAIMNPPLRRIMKYEGGLLHLYYSNVTKN